jgi:hypothetical protein
MKKYRNFLIKLVYILVMLPLIILPFPLPSITPNKKRKSTPISDDKNPGSGRRHLNRKAMARLL